MSNTLISCKAMIIDVDDAIRKDRPINDQMPQGSPIDAGEDVRIAWGVAILKGVRIGLGAVIGGGNTVTRDVPPHCVKRVSRRGK